MEVVFTVLLNRYDSSVHLIKGIAVHPVLELVLGFVALPGGVQVVNRACEKLNLVSQKAFNLLVRQVFNPRNDAPVGIEQGDFLDVVVVIFKDGEVIGVVAVVLGMINLFVLYICF